MKRFTHSLLPLLLLITLGYGCTKKEYTYEYVYGKPSVGAVGVTNVTSTSALLTGNIGKDGGKSLSERGFILSNVSFSGSVPSGATRIKANQAGLGSFSTELTGLKSGVTYFACAYCKNEDGETRGAVSSFTTLVDPAVSMESMDCNSVYHFIGNDGNSDYMLIPSFKVKFVRVDEIESIGVNVNGDNYDYPDNLPSEDGSITLSPLLSNFLYSDDGEFSVTAYPYAHLKNGTRLRGEVQTTSVSAMGVQVAPYLCYWRDPLVEWFAEPDKQYYIHRLSIDFKMLANVENISKLSFYLSNDYKLKSFGGGSGFKTGSFYSMDYEIKSNESSLKLSLYGEALLNNGVTLIISDYTGHNEVTSTYGTSASHEVLMGDDFETGLGNWSDTFSNIAESDYTWIWNSYDNTLAAHPYSNEPYVLADTWAVSREIDLNGKSNASISFEIYAQDFSDFTRDFGLQVWTASSNTWTSLDVSEINTSLWYSKEYNFSLDPFVGERIRIAFTFKSTTEDCGLVRIGKIRVYQNI